MNAKQIFRNSQYIMDLKAGGYVITPKVMLHGYKNLNWDTKHFYSILTDYGYASLLTGSVDPEGHPMIYVSKQTLADEHEVSHDTISRHLKALEKEGLIKRQKRGLGKTDFIYLYPPKDSKHSNFTDILKEANDIIDASISRNTDSDTRKNTDSNTRKNAFSNTRKNTFSNEANLSDLSDHISENLGNTIVSTSSIYTKIIKDKEEIVVADATSVEDSPKSSSENTLKDIVKKATEKSIRAHDRKVAKKEQKPKVEKQKTCKDLLKVFDTEVEEGLHIKPSMSTAKDLKQLKDLLEYYGYDIVVTAIKWTVQNWSSFKRGVNLKASIPTIGILYGYRGTIFTEAQTVTQKCTRNEDEFI